MPNWRKIILSGSTANLNSLTVTNGITGSLFGTASYTTQALSASYAPSSNAFPYIGDAQITGSLLVTGSVIISGSKTGGSNPSIKIDGGVQLDGYLRFEPVDIAINTSISASYIFVSGSTRDLYFSQNGQGYNNVTRLRWLEGNLYSGLLNGGLITTQSSTVYQVSSGSGIIVTLNASLNNDPYPTSQYINWGNLSASIAPLSASYDQSFIAIEATGSLGKIYVSGTPYSDGQFDTLIPIGNVIHQNRSTINATATYPSVAYGFKQRSNDFIKAFGPLKLSGLNTYVSGSSTGSLIVTSGTAYSDGRNYRTDPNNPSYVTDSGIAISKIYRYYQSGSGWVYNTNGGVGFGAIDPTQYSLDGVLTAVPGGGANRQWSIQRVYYFPAGATKGIYVYYGNATYATKVEAIANIPFEDFVEAPNTAAGAILSAYLIVRNNANFTNADSYSIQQGGLFRNIGGAGGGGSVVTQTLAGLSDVAISGPTNGQPLVYNTTATKWQNQSTLTATLIGNASSATTASLVNGNVNVTTATIGNTVYATAGTTIGAGTTSIYSVSNASYSSIFVDYAINEGTTNARAGTIQVISVGSDINYTETTTMDIGNTNDITWSIYLSGADINFDIVNAAGASWTIKFSSRQM